ncbi:MAG: hypothetical protein ACRDD7_01070 [Peptostreptococcaceae bacterium]
MSNYNLKQELQIFKETILDTPIQEIPFSIGSIFLEYECIILARDHSEHEITVLMKLEYFRDDLESSNKMSINDIIYRLDEIINII